MGRVNDDNWLDEALNEAIHSADTQPDFEKWKAEHPEAVEMLTTRTPQTQRPLRIRRIIMNATFVKLAAAAAIAVAAIFGVTHLTKDRSIHGTDHTISLDLLAVEPLAGPTTHKFADGSVVKLAEGASIRTYANAGKRGFAHVAGQIEVTVAKGKGEFIVTSPYGQVKALGTQFTMNMMDEVAANTNEHVQLLAVKVTEGKVEVRNTQGTTTLAANQDIVVALNAAPYDFNKDEKLPQELRTRVQSLINALKAKDGAAWVANFNLPYLFKLAKGQVAYDPNLFGGTAEDAQNFQKGLGDKVGSPEELGKIVASTVNFDGGEVYVTSITMNKAGDHATAKCVSKNGNRTIGHSPQWHHFDGGWWQIDD
jgi:ferric-dicitrate binding protein FerR (iron transport regulator)